MKNVKVNINEVLRRPEYEFIKQQERLGKHIDFLVFGGSIAYGLNTPTSDIDIRGITSPLKRDLLGSIYLANPEDLLNKDVKLQKGFFEQYMDTNTDTCVYNVLKYLDLIYECNPNTIEMLGCLPEHYAYVSESGKLLLDNVDIFLTKRAYYTFSNYARQQLIRLHNSLVGNATDLEKKLQTLSIIQRMYQHLEEAFPTFKRDMIDFYVIDSRDNRIDLEVSNVFFQAVELSEEEKREKLSHVDMENCELRVNLNMQDISPNDLKGVIGEINNVVDNFSSHTGHRNNKNTKAGEDKQASHIRRLQKTCKIILREHRIQTHLGDDAEEIFDIKRGSMRNRDGSYKKEFFDKTNEDMKELEELFKTCTLPEKPDDKKVLNLIKQINEAAMNR